MCWVRHSSKGAYPHDSKAKSPFQAPCLRTQHLSCGSWLNSTVGLVPKGRFHKNPGPNPALATQEGTKAAPLPNREPNSSKPQAKGRLFQPARQFAKKFKEDLHHLRNSGMMVSFRGAKSGFRHHPPRFPKVERELQILGQHGPARGPSRRRRCGLSFASPKAHRPDLTFCLSFSFLSQFVVMAPKAKPAFSGACEGQLNSGIKKSLVGERGCGCGSSKSF